MGNSGSRTFRIAVLLLSLACAVPAAAYGESFKAPPDFPERIRNIGTIGILLPHVKVFEISSGGAKELRPDWCQEARLHLQSGFEEEFRKIGFGTKAMGQGPDADAEIQEVLTLHEVVVQSTVHAYDGPASFPEKMKSFDYTVGPIDNILKGAEVDALLVVHALDEVSTAGRKAMQTLGTVAAAAIGVVAIPQGGRTVLIVSMMDRSGDFLWFNVQGGTGNFNLREPGSASGLVRQALTGFPGKAK